LRKKSLLIAVILIFALVSTAIALENQNAGQNFKGADYLTSDYLKSVNSSSPSLNQSSAEDVNDSGLSGNQIFNMNRLLLPAEK